MQYSRLYAIQLRSSRKMAQFVDNHPQVFNAILTAEAIMGAWLVVSHF